MRYQSYLNTAGLIIESYKGTEPLSSFLKKFFAADKKYGSKDRKQIAALCYHYFRLGKAVQHMPVNERIILATFLCESSNNDFLKFHRPEWNDKIAATIKEKLSIINAPFSIDDIFPWKDELSEGIGYLQLSMSFLQQPLLFLRIRPGKKDIVVKQFQAVGIRFELIGDDCIALPNATKLDGIVEIDKDVVVQDLNSQRVLDYLKTKVHSSQIAVRKEPEVLSSNPASAWDCCAASGGKSILACDILQGNLKLMVSDIRKNSLINLEKRFSTAGIKNYDSFITDLTTANSQLPVTNCKLIICDAPCTGSGTWSRTPEQLFYFDSRTINVFADLQKKIVSKATPALAEGGLFFYITCSVFEAENEKITEFIKKEFHLQLLQVESLTGYDKNADSMYVAVFTR